MTIIDVFLMLMMNMRMLALRGNGRSHRSFVVFGYLSYLGICARTFSCSMVDIILKLLSWKLSIVLLGSCLDGEPVVRYIPLELEFIMWPNDH